MNNDSNNLSQFVKRDVIGYELPLPPLVSNPELVLLRFSHNSIDIGALCYLRRSGKARVPKNNGENASKLVDIGSYSSERALQICKMLTHFSNLMTAGGYRLSTIQSTAALVIRLMDWADKNNHPHILAEGAHDGFNGYVQHLRERVNRHEISLASAAKEQGMVYRILADLTGMYDLHRGVQMLTVGNTTWNSVELPSEQKVAKVESLCEALFLGFSNLALNKVRYPFKLELPNWLGWQENSLWVFPIVRWCMPPHILASRPQLEKPYWAYDYRNGCLEKSENIWHHYYNRHLARCITQNANDLLDAANNDMRHSHRIKCAKIALNAFVLLFLGQTGMNFSIAAALRWETDFIVGQEQQGFRELKWRAGGKLITTVIRLNFLPLFKKYLELREFLLKDKHCNLLFFTLGCNQVKEPEEIQIGVVVTCYKTLATIDPTIQRINVRKLRAAKQDFHVRNSDPATSAKIMGHSEETALKYYTLGSQSVHFSEVSHFFEKVHQTSINKKTILSTDHAVGKNITGHLGCCIAYDNPEVIANESPIVPNCKILEGCLFCNKYRVHADEADTRKLASCAYVLQQAAYLPSGEQYFQPIFIRIKALLHDIAEQEGNAEMVSRVVHEVEQEGELDSYWAHKLSLLNELEISI